MNPSSIKKIINKKVTFIVLHDHLPTEKGRSPISIIKLIFRTVLLNHN